jgi:hypothetical protein
VALFQCTGTQTLPFLKTALPTVDVITSTRPLLIRETPALEAALYKAIENGDSYRQMRRRLQACSWERGNLIFPDQSANLRHVDFDPNGVLDCHDPAGLLQTLQGPARGAAMGLMSGVHFLTSLNPYYVEQSAQPVFRPDQVRIPLIAKGLAAGNLAGGAPDAVAQVRSTQVGGKRRFEVALDQRYTGESRTFIGAAAVYDVQLALQREFIGNGGGLRARLGSFLGRPQSDPQRNKVRALAFAADYLDLIPRDQSEAQAAFDRLTRLHGLPKLSLWSVQGALGSHVVDERAVDRLEQMIRSARQ